MGWTAFGLFFQLIEGDARFPIKVLHERSLGEERKKLESEKACDVTKNSAGLKGVRKKLSR